MLAEGKAAKARPLGLKNFRASFLTGNRFMNYFSKKKQIIEYLKVKKHILNRKKIE